MKILKFNESNKNEILQINDDTNIDDILYFRVRNDDHDLDLVIFRKLLKKIYNIYV
jgi:hypothetical protein